MRDWPIFLLLLLTALAAMWCRARLSICGRIRCEPFLVQSIVIALCTAASVVVLAKTSGAMGVSLAYFLVLGVAGVISATTIFRTKRSQWSQAEA